MKKYSVPYITLVRSQCQLSTYYRPVRYACSPSGCVTACVVYTADSIRDSIRTKKNDSQVPTSTANERNKLRASIDLSSLKRFTRSTESDDFLASNFEPVFLLLRTSRDALNISFDIFLYSDFALFHCAMSCVHHFPQASVRVLPPFQPCCNCVYNICK